MDNKRLFRSNRDKMIAGVCGGLANYLGMDPTVIRLIFLLLLFLGGNGFLIYLIMWIVVPAEPAV